jgi:hypothetical protein
MFINVNYMIFLNMRASSYISHWGPKFLETALPACMGKLGKYAMFFLAIAP